VSVRTALRQLEHAEDYLDAVAGLLPDLEEEVERIVEDVEVLKEELARRRLAS
jgi:hypothetical protein